MCLAIPKMSFNQIIFLVREILELNVLQTQFFIKTFNGKPESTFSFVNDNALARFYIYDICTTSISLMESLQGKFNMLNLSVNTVNLSEPTIY